MGLLDYYRQFEDLDERQLNRERRARRHRERQLALEQVPDLDLSGTEWPDLPNSEVMNASIYTARGRVNGYPDRHATRVRAALAERHGIEPERIVLGNGAAELLQSAAMALLGPGDELVTPWPSYPLYPLLAARAGARAVPVDSHSPADLCSAVNQRTRLVIVCNPNDPTGEHMPSDQLYSLLSELPPEVTLVLDEALVHFQDAEPVDAGLRLTDVYSNLVVIRTFSKIYGLSGLRAGYAVAGRDSAELLDKLAPVLGVNALTQSAVEQALKIGGPEVERRREAVLQQRTRLLDSLASLPLEATPTQANFVWLAAYGVSGLALTNALKEQGVIVAPGGPLGADDHIRAAIRNSGATDRFLAALGRVLET